MAERVVSPQWQHDCEACRFMGTVLDAYAVGKPAWVDLWYCPKGQLGGGSLIARYGDEGGSYLSSPVHYAASDTGPPAVAKTLYLAMTRHNPAILNRPE